MLTLSLLYVVLVLTCTPISQASKIDPTLSARLKTSGKVDVVVSFNKGVKYARESVSSLQFDDPNARSQAIVDALKKHADKTQAGLVDSLSSSVRVRSGGGFKYTKSYWTSNRLFVKEADAETIQTIEENPEVDKIKLAPVSSLPIPEPEPQAPSRSDIQFRSVLASKKQSYNFARVQIAEAWEELGGNQGSGVVIGAIDSGAKDAHHSIASNFRGNTEYGWFDGVNGSAKAYDLVGHGTMVISILAGAGLGVAPGATWMMCRGCEGSLCPFENIMNCINFMSCPTLPDGSKPDCSKRPHILNYSISGQREGEEYDEDFKTMRDLGIISVAAAGNTGPACGTSTSPGNMPWVISVGNTQDHADQIQDMLYYTSALGPAPDGTVKPDLVAPGTYVRVAAGLGNDLDGTVVNVGTSFAAPHVAGAIALLRARNPKLTFDEAFEFLTKTADPGVLLMEWNTKCSEDAERIPNNFFGWGRLNVLKAVQAQTVAMGGTIGAHAGGKVASENLENEKKKATMKPPFLKVGDSMYVVILNETSTEER